MRGDTQASPAEELFDLASDCRLLADMEAGELRTLSRYLVHRSFPQGEVLFEQGRAGAGLWFLVSGNVDILKEADGNRQKQVATVRSGQTLGEISLMDKQPSSAMARTASDCEILHLSQAQFETLLKETPRLGITLLRKIAQQLSRRLRQTTGLLVDHLE